MVVVGAAAAAVVLVVKLLTQVFFFYIIEITVKPKSVQTVFGISKISSFFSISSRLTNVSCDLLTFL